MMKQFSGKDTKLFMLGVTIFQLLKETKIYLKIRHVVLIILVKNLLFLKIKVKEMGKDPIKASRRLTCNTLLLLESSCKFLLINDAHSVFNRLRSSFIDTRISILGQ